MLQNLPITQKIVGLTFPCTATDVFSPLLFLSVSERCHFPGALQIENSEETDQGKYECVASNVEGVRYSSPANLYVRGRKQPGRRARTNK